MNTAYLEKIPDPSYRIVGEKIVLRPIQPEDTDNALKWRNDPLVVKNFIYKKPVTREDHEKWLSEKVSKGLVHQFVISIKETGHEIGCVYLHNIDGANNKAESGIYMAGGQEYYGHGYGSEAVCLIKKYAFEELGFHKLVARVLSFNEASAHLHMKAGYKKEAHLEGELYLDGEYQDLMLYGVVNDK